MIDHIDIQVGPDPSDTTRVMIVSPSHDREDAIAAIQASGDFVVVCDSDQRDIDPDHVVLGILRDALRVAAELPALMVPMVRIKPERRQTRAEWRAQMKGRR